MRILFTGSSSFTGYWFIEELLKAGHEVIATYRKKRYTGLRKERVDRLKGRTPQAFGAPFGSEPFMRLIEEYGCWDLICHHGAETKNYKSEEFSTKKAVEGNTYNAEEVLDLLKQRGAQALILSSTYFQKRHLTPYSTSKTQTARIFSSLCKKKGLSFCEFVIPNPFGPLEEPRLSTHLGTSWFKGKVPTIETPLYVRDFIPIPLLAKAYRKLVETKKRRFAPSGSILSLPEFAERLGQELSHRWERPTRFKTVKQTLFTEPFILKNTQTVELSYAEEQAFYDALAADYAERGSRPDHTQRKTSPSSHSAPSLSLFS